MPANFGARGGFGIPRGGAVARDRYDAAVLAVAELAHWWKFAKGQELRNVPGYGANDYQVFKDEIGGWDLWSYNRAIRFTTGPSLVGHSSNGALVFPGGASLRYPGTVNNPFFPAFYSYEFWCIWPTASNTCLGGAWGTNGWMAYKLNNDLIYYPGSTSLSAGTLTVGARYHIVCMYNGSSGNARIYVNGQLAAGPTYFAYKAPDRTFEIGNYNNSTGTFVEAGATIDEAALYARELTADEVASHYALGV